MPRPPRSLAFRLVRALFAGIAICYFVLTGAIWYAQTKILYHPSSSVDATPGDSGEPFDNITLPLKGDQLAGWWVPSQAPQPRTLLYLHGNAANVAANLDDVLRLRNTGLNVFIIDYKLIIHGDADTMVPPLMARRLYDAAQNPKQIAMIPGGRHENSAVVNATAYFAALNAFLARYDFKPGGAAAK